MVLQDLSSSSTRAGFSELRILQENQALSVIGYSQCGYVIIANDDRFNAVIGYSPKAFQENNPGLKWWLKAISEVMTSNEASVSETNLVDSKEAVPQLMKSEWGQSAPFNNLCPMGVNGRCPAGCVATAMAQVFYYHKYPVKAIGKGSCTYGGKTYAQELSGVEYAWDKMLPKYDTPSGEGSEDVATLLYDCGLSIGMNYDDNGSGSYNFEACNAINEHFNMYATYYNRSYYTSSDWMNILYQQLSQKNPVVYTGVSKVDGVASGHCFVIDGYREDGLVHVNWGWDGQGDGYYDIALLNPVVGDSMSFSLMQDMVICQKAPIAVFSNIGMKGITMQVTDASHFMVNISSATNLLPQDFNGELAIIAEADGKKHILKRTSKKLVFAVDYSSLFDDNICSVEELEDGEYRIYAAAKSKDDPDWQVFRASRGGRNSYVLTKANGSIKLVADRKAWSTGISLPIVGDSVSPITYVYDMNGRLVYQAATSAFSSSNIPAKGIFIIKQGDSYRKIVKQ